MQRGASVENRHGSHGKAKAMQLIRYAMRVQMGGAGAEGGAEEEEEEGR